jgi:hypothetical protein
MYTQMIVFPSLLLWIRIYPSEMVWNEIMGNHGNLAGVGKIVLTW